MAFKRFLPTSTPDGSAPISWRRNLYALAIAQVLAIAGFTLRDSFMPFFLKDIGATSNSDAALWSGLVQAGGAGVMAITAPIWGVVADRRGRKPMVLRAMFASTVTVGLCALVTAPWQLFTLRLLEGAFAGTVAASTALVATSAPKRELGYALGIVQTSVFVGASVGPFLGGLMAHWFGYRITFLIAAACLALAGIIVLTQVEERFTPVEHRGKASLRGLRQSSSWILAPALVAMIVVLFLSRFAQMGVRPILPLYIGELGNLPDTRAVSLSGTAFGMMGITSAISAIYLGRKSDRIGHGKVLLISVTLTGLVYIPMALATAPWQMIVLLALFGLGAGGLLPAANAIVANNAPAERRGAIFGITTSAMSVGAFLGPLACSAVAALCSFSAAFLFVAIVTLGVAAALAYMLVKRPMDLAVTVAAGAD
jgi:MFS transporter, DHA1 family, multidrug resistance protein